jgi:hypothetical protein
MRRYPNRPRMLAYESSLRSGVTSFEDCLHYLCSQGVRIVRVALDRKLGSIPVDTGKYNSNFHCLSFHTPTDVAENSHDKHARLSVGEFILSRIDNERQDADRRVARRTISLLTGGETFALDCRPPQVSQMFSLFPLLLGKLRFSEVENQ